MHEAQMTSRGSAILSGAWRARLLERDRLKGYGTATELVAFDKIARRSARREAWHYIHLGDPEGLEELRRQLRSASGEAIAPALSRTSEVLARVRHVMRDLPAPLRGIGRKFASLLPH